MMYFIMTVCADDLSGQCEIRTPDGHSVVLQESDMVELLEDWSFAMRPILEARQHRDAKDARDLKLARYRANQQVRDFDGIAWVIQMDPDTQPPRAISAWMRDNPMDVAIGLIGNPTAPRPYAIRVRKLLPGRTQPYMVPVGGERFSTIENAIRVANRDREKLLPSTRYMGGRYG